MKPYALYATDSVGDLQELVCRCTQKFADKDAFRIRLNATEYRGVSFKQFGKDLCALGNAIIHKELSGSRYAIIGENTYEWILAYLAGTNSNTTVVPLDKELLETDILDLVTRADIRAFFYSDTYADIAKAVEERTGNTCVFINMSDVKPRTGHLSFSSLLELGYGLMAQGTDLFSGIEIDPLRPCAILFTSGTTGKSKGVMLSHGNIATNVTAAVQMIRFTDADTVLSVLPVHHSFESTCGILCMLHTGTTVCFNTSVKDLPSNLQLFKPTGLVLVPLYVETFLKRIWSNAEKSGKAKKLRAAIRITNFLQVIGIHVKRKVLKEVHDFFGGRLKKIIVGGAYTHPTLVQGLRDFDIQLLQGYGITECSPLVSANREFYYRDDSAGLVVPCCEVRIDAPSLLAGELLVRGTNVMLGYLDDPEATAAAFDGEWFKTGDIGYIDNCGFLHITGRCKNIIVLKNGKNVSPEEIESHFQRYPLISQVIVTAGDADALGVDSLVAIFYPNPEIAEGTDRAALTAMLQDIIDEINGQLPLYKRITDFSVRDTPFPQTASKKIIRYKVQDDPGR